MSSLFSKFVVSWIDSDDIEVYDNESVFNSRVRDLIGWGYIEGDDFVTWNEF